ncbi:Nn.00g041080.m01.CDS01 [Neocucurbitaria sp. VM-36]
MSSEEEEADQRVEDESVPTTDRDEQHESSSSSSSSSSSDDDDDDDEDDSESEVPADLMVTTRARRANAGNRMSTLLAKSAEEEDEWGEEWEEAPNEEEFRGDDVNEQEDYNMESSSSEEEDDGGDEDDVGEKELRKAERQERNKKRKATTNPFAARVAAVNRKKVKLDVPGEQSSASAPPRPKKKSERASWIPTEEDGPIRTSSRKQTIANKETTLAKLKEKDRRRDDTLAMMKAAEARKAKAKEKPLTQAERLAEAARNERINKKTLHRWEEAEEARAAERQAKIDALKNRQIDGPFIRYYSGPSIWVDEKLKFTGKDAPSLESLEEKLNKEVTAEESQTSHTEPTEQPEEPIAEQAQPQDNSRNPSQPPQGTLDSFQTSMSQLHGPLLPTSQPPTQQQQEISLPWTAASHGGDVFMGSHGMSYPNSIMFAPPSQDSFLFGIDQYAQNQQSQSTPSDLPPNPFTQASPYQQQYTTSQPHPSLSDPLLTQQGGAVGPQALLAQFQKPLPPPAPPRRKVIRRALRNLLILSNFSNLDAPSTSSRAKTAASLLKDKDRAALVQLSMTLFNWSLPDATLFVNAMLVSSTLKPTKKNLAALESALPQPKKPLCAVTNAIARYRDPETGIAYRDARAFGVLRGVVGGGFVWSGALGCYVGGRAKPLESMQGGKGFLGMPPAKNVPRQFWEMLKKTSPTTTMAAPSQTSGQAQTVGETPASASMPTPTLSGRSVAAAPEVGQQNPSTAVKTEAVVANVGNT